MKVLHVLASNKYSGAENVVCQIINLFKNEDNIEMVYCSVDGPIRTILAEKDVNFFGIKKLSVNNLKKIINKYQPDIIHAHDMKASLICSFASKSIPIISHIHNNSFASRKISIKSISFLIACRKISHIFWVTKSAFRDFKFINKIMKKSSVLENVLDVKKIYEKVNQDNNNYSFDVIFLGRLSFPKNPLRLIDVLSLAIDKVSDLKVAIVGEGELLNETIEYTKKMNIYDNITFFGYMNNPMKILASSKVMLMTSRWEGIPMCALEAKALNVKIVSTPTDGLKDIINNSEKGFLSDNNFDLAEKIIEFISVNHKTDNDSFKNQIIHNNSIELLSYKCELKKKYKENLKNGENLE